MSKLDMRNTMIELHLISPFHVEPTPDQSNLGRFDKAIRSVTNLQDTRSIYVRPTMITIISNTKFKTSSGLPISLVGLHGKDELLVTGPAWAILKLAQGRCSLYVLLTIFTPPDSQDFALLGSWL